MEAEQIKTCRAIKPAQLSGTGYIYVAGAAGVFARVRVPCGTGVIYGTGLIFDTGYIIFLNSPSWYLCKERTK